MDTTQTLNPGDGHSCEHSDLSTGNIPALVILWCRHEPHRVGECILIPPKGGTIGRGPNHLPITRRRLGTSSLQDPFTSPSLSKRQLEIVRPEDGTVWVQNWGQRNLWVGQTLADNYTPLRLNQGDLVEIRGELLLLLSTRPLVHEYVPSTGEDFPRFGQPDVDGFVGESAAMWRLRMRIPQVAAIDHHTLIVGEHGTGKELAVNAIRLLSLRRARRFASRAAAALLSNSGESEFFGNLRDHPYVGMSAQEGLVASSEGGILFLDEIGDLTLAQQPRLLRLLDHREYYRVGDELEKLTANVRVLATTSLPISALNPHLMSLFPVQVKLPSLLEMPEDIPLVAESLLMRWSQSRPAFQTLLPSSGPLLSCGSVRRLVTYPFTSNVRQLERILLEALQTRQHDQSQWDKPLSVLPPQATAVTPSPATAGPPPPSPAASVPPPLNRDLLARLLQEHGGERAGVVDELKARGHKVTDHKLKNLLKEWQLEVPRDKDRITREMLVESLRRWGGNKARVAEELKTTRAIIIGLIDRYGLTRGLGEG